MVRVKTPKQLLEVAEDWLPNGSLLVDGKEFTIEMRRDCGQTIAISSWRNGQGHELHTDRLFTKFMIEPIN